MYNNVNKQIRRQVGGRGYSWNQLLLAVRKHLVKEGHIQASPVLSNPAIAAKIREIYPLKTKSLNTDAILLEYARYVLKRVP